MLQLILLLVAVTRALGTTHIINQNSGTILSDNYMNGNYSNWTSERWVINTTELHIQFVFEQFLVEGAYNSCFDYIKFIDISMLNSEVCSSKPTGVAVSCQTGLFCQACNPGTHLVDTNAVIIDFCSDMSGNGKFKIVFKPFIATTPSSPTIAPAIDCGIQAPGYEPDVTLITDENLDGRIVGGSGAKPHSWPWAAVFMEESEDGKWTAICGGSVISDRFVLTAGHCATGNHANVIVKLGAQNRGTTNDANEATQQNFTVSGNPYFHPNFNVDTKAYDAAIVKLNGQIDYNDFVRPICLPSVDYSAYPGDAVIIGWGDEQYQDPSTQPLTLQQTVVAVHSDLVCSNLTINDVIYDSDCMLCAGGDGLTDHCNGDSGGPLLQQVDTLKGDVQGKEWVIGGIISWGDDDCAVLGHSGVYTKVTSVVDWIHYVLRTYS